MNIHDLLKLLWCGYFVMTTTSQVHWEPVMIEHPTDKVVRNPGDTVILKCRVLNRQSEVVWCLNRFCSFGRQGTNHYPYKRQFKLTEDGKRSVIVDDSKGQFDLMITNFSSDDEGEYQCQLLKTARHNAIISNTALVVLLNRTIEQKPSRVYTKPIGKVKQWRRKPLIIPHLKPLVLAITTIKLYFIILLLVLMITNRNEGIMYEEMAYSVVVA
ncbi:hypothetical protein ACOME3_009158 [Neoechinorhynchus agilis]